MKRRLLTILSCLALAFSAIGFAACGGNNASENSSENEQSSTVTENSSEGQSSTVTESLQFQKIKDKDEYRVVGLGNVSDLDIIIPSTYKGLPVTEIGDLAFVIFDKSVDGYYYNGIEQCWTSVTIPDRATLPSLHPQNNYSTL